MKIYLVNDFSISLLLAAITRFLNTKFQSVKFEELANTYKGTYARISTYGTHDKYLLQLNAELEEQDFIIVVTNKQYDSNVFYDVRKKSLVILSFFGWDYLSSLPVENGLLYFICSMLLDEMAGLQSFDHPTGINCVNDYLSNKTRVHEIMRSGSFCKECWEELKEVKLTMEGHQVFTEVRNLLSELAACSQAERNIINNETNDIADTKYFNLPAGPSITGMNEPISIFISYSHEDESYRTALEKHFAMLKRLGVINTWSDRDINAGEKWRNKIDKNLNSAQVILLLISSDFLASPYCFEIEMKTALARHERGEVNVIPIIVRDCDWEEAPFAQLQALPSDNKPVSGFTDPDKAYKGIVRAIAKMIEETYKKG